ncbi:MAG TPA: prephenate dehydrogenase/arogenate dehydrogenase family protein, partial [Candidatus Dojkabacteria bacterium]
TVDSDFIIPCVAIRAFEEVIEEISKFIKTGATTMDVNSVKLHPVEVMEKNLPQGVNIIASHPMWGAGTIKHNENSTKNLNMVLWNVRSDENKYKEIKSFLEDDLELNLTEMDPDEHDRLSAKFQFLTQVSAQVYKSLGLQETDIDTKSAILVRELIEIVQADKDLTKDMYVFNPYCKKELELMDKYYSEFKEFLKL